MILRAALLMLLVFASFRAKAADERFSVTNWNTQLASALKSGGLKKASVLLDVKSLEKNALICASCEDKKNMTQARKVFAQGKYSAALDLYNKVSRGTDYWFEAVEEKGWSYFRQDDLEKALAQTKTLISPQFAEVVNSEAFFLQSLSQLKMCDYKGVFETHTLFKEKQKARIMNIQDLAKTGMNDAFSKVIAKADKFPVILTDVSESISALPLMFYRDKEIQTQMLRFQVSQKGLETLKSQNASVKVQEQFQKMNADALALLKNRMKELAQEETNANFKVIQKLNLVEVEAIQRIHTDMAMSDELYNERKFQKVDSDKLVFMDDGRPWIDELDKYEVTSKACAKNIRRKM